MRFVSICLAFWLSIIAALADPNIPEVATNAAAYRDEIAALKVESTAPQVLRAIRQAEEAKDKARLVKLYEQLVALNSTNFRAWLHLAQAWREVEPSADKGLSSAFNAYTATRAGPDQLEALLFMTSVMRKRLELFGGQHVAAQSEVQKLKNVQDYSDKAESDGDVPPRDRTDPLGSAKLLEKSLQAANLVARQVTEQIIQVVAELDEVYREIAKRLPALKLDDMRSKDFRSRVFEVKLGNDGKPRVDFQTQKGDVHACVFFTQDLKAEDGLSYRKFLDVVPQSSGDSSDDNKATAFGVDAAGGRGRLCITNLRPGGTYNVTLKAGLPSMQGGSLAEAVNINEVKLPDLPGQIGFSGKHFVLPKSGDGEVPLFITNIDTFGLELLRITDRTLHRHVALGNIGGELKQSDYDDIRGQFGERIWSAAVKVKEDAGKSNETLRTYLPVRRILKARQEALARRAADNSGDSVRCSLPVELSGVRGLTIRGRDCADTASFEREVLKRPMRGVFALVTRDTIKLSKAEQTSNTSDATDDPDGPLDSNGEQRYLVQWFLDTDIGLTFYEGSSEFYVVARSLGSGEAKRGIRIELVSANNRVLAADQTDPNGMVKFPRSLTRGDQGNKLVAVLAYSDADDDFGFVTVGNERLNLARLNLDGRSVGDRLSAFLTTDRGIYEPGEKINITAIVRDSKGQAPDGPFKATIRLEARDRVIKNDDTVEAKDWKLGGMTRQIEVPRTARHGAVRIVLARGSSESAPVLGETLVQIGPVRPDRARLIFAERGWDVRKTTSELVKVKGTVSAQYLYGTVGHTQAAAGELRIEGQIKVGAADSPADNCYDNFAFGGTDDPPTMTTIRQFVDHTDKDGKLNIDRIGANPSASSRPLAATVELTMYDATGPLASASKSYPIANDKGWIGISKIPRLRQGARPGTFDLDIDLVSTTSDNQPEQDRELDVQLQREQDVYVWQRAADNWQHIKRVDRVGVTKSKLSTERLRRVGAAPARNCVRAIDVPGLAKNLDVGRYVLTIADPQNNRRSSIRFNVGSVTTDTNQLEPNIFALSTDKPTYRVGETIKISPKVSFEGPALVAIADSDIQHWQPGVGNKDIEVQARQEWEGKGMYALATVFRAQADGTMNTGPGRAIGATYFEVVGSRSGYDVAVDVIGTSGQPLAGHPAINPNEPSQLRVCIADASRQCSNFAGEAYASIFIVDQGLLSLTGHHDILPDPKRHFHGRTRFALTIMDNYDRLLLKEGGDRPTRLALSNYISPRIVSLSLTPEPVRLVNGRATLPIPKLDLQAGAVSIYAIVWSRDYAAGGETKVSVRNRIVAELAVPRFLNAGDRAIMQLRLENISALHQGEYAVRASSSGPVRSIAIFASGETPPTSARPELRIALPQSDRKSLYMAVQIEPDGRDDVQLRLSLEAVGATPAQSPDRSEWTFKVRPEGLHASDVISFPLTRQPANLAASINSVVANYVENTVQVTARFSDSDHSMLAALVKPGGEQPPPIIDHLIWRGVLLLHGAKDGDPRIPEVIRILSEIQSLQQPNGSFVPYRTIEKLEPGEVSVVYTDSAQPQSEPDPKDGLFRTASVLDFMTLASQAGYDVSERTLRGARLFAMSQLKKRPQRDCSIDALYALLVLLGTGDADPEQVSTLDCKEDALMKAASAAVLLKFGDPGQAKTILASFGGKDAKDMEPLSGLSDFRMAMILAFLTEASAPAELIEKVATALLCEDLKGRCDRDRPPARNVSLSPGAMAWVARASTRDAKRPAARTTPIEVVPQGGLVVRLQRKQSNVLETQPIRYTELNAAPTTFTARSDGVRALVTVEGQLIRPTDAKRAPANSLKRRLFKLDSGDEIDLSSNNIKIGDRLVVVIEATQGALTAARGPESEDKPVESMLVADLLPSAFEVIPGDVFGRKDLLGKLATLEAAGNLRSVDLRPDRWVAVIAPTEEADDTPGATGKAKEPGQNLTSTARRPAQDVPGNVVQFRQAYLVRVNMAGQFTMPAITIEPTAPPVKTLRAEQTRIDVKLAEIPPR